jgi:chromosome segregation ATPase
MMNLALEKINTLTGYDILLASAQKKKQLLERRRRNLGESIDTFRKRMDDLEKESAETQSILIALTATYNSLPEGSRDRVSMNVDIKRRELRQARLDKKAFTCNIRALLIKQLQYNRLDAQVLAIDCYIALLENKRMALRRVFSRVIHKASALRPPVVHLKSRFKKGRTNRLHQKPQPIHQNRQRYSWRT